LRAVAGLCEAWSCQTQDCQAIGERTRLLTQSREDLLHYLTRDHSANWLETELCFWLTIVETLLYGSCRSHEVISKVLANPSSAKDVNKYLSVLVEKVQAGNWRNLDLDCAPTEPRLEKEVRAFGQIGRRLLLGPIAAGGLVNNPSLGFDDDLGYLLRSICARLGI